METLNHLIRELTLAGIAMAIIATCAIIYLAISR